MGLSPRIDQGAGPPGELAPAACAHAQLLAAPCADLAWQPAVLPGLSAR